MTDQDAPPLALAEGSRVCGNYVIGRFLRRGPLTSTWLARAIGDDEPRHVARVVHVRRPDAIARAPMLRESFRELQDLRHGAIPELVATSVEGDEPVLVTSRVFGRTLRAIESRQPRPQLSVVARVVADVAEVLEVLHARRPAIVHRVVCPENIVVDGEGRVWLEECGFAHALVAAGWLPEAVVPNLPSYRSPHDLRHEVHPRTDVFALAAVAFEWLTGRSPFSGDTEAERAIAVLVGRRPSVSGARLDLPTDLDEVFEKAWDTADGGYPTPGALARALDGVSRGARLVSLNLRSEGSRDTAPEGQGDELDTAFVAMVEPPATETETDLESENPTLRLRALSAETRLPPPLPEEPEGRLSGEVLNAEVLNAEVAIADPPELPKEPPPVGFELAETPEEPPPQLELPLKPGDLAGEDAQPVEFEPLAALPEASRSEPISRGIVLVTEPARVPVVVAATSSPDVVPVQLMVATRVARNLGVAIVLAAVIVAGAQMYIAHLSQPTVVSTPALVAASAAQRDEVRSVAPSREPVIERDVTPVGLALADAGREEPPDVVTAVAAAPDVVAIVTDVTVIAAADAPALPLRPSLLDLQRAQGRLASPVLRCVGSTDVGSAVRLIVTYSGHTGRAVRVDIPGPPNEEPMGSCIEGAVLRVSMAPFASPSWQTTYVFPTTSRR